MEIDKHLTEEEKEELEQLGINKAPECQFAKNGFEEKYIACSWDENGVLYTGILDEMVAIEIDEKYNLTPIKKPWYEDESNIGKIVSYDFFDYTKLGIFKGQDKDKKWLQIMTLDGHNCVQKTHKVKLATKEEVLSLVGE